MSTALAERPIETALSATEMDLIKRTVANGATDAELKLFLFDCQRRGVHPLDKLLHFTKRGGKYTPVTSIDFMRSQAAMSGEMAGSDDPVFGNEGMEPGLPPTQATVTVYRLTQGQRFAYTATARWSEYCPDNAPMWRRMPHTMLGKCAEALALRKAFPQQLAGLYTSDEMAQAPEDSPAALIVMPLPPPAQASSVPLPSKPNGGDSDSRSSRTELTGDAALSPVSIPPGFDLIAEVRPSRAGSVGELVMRSGEFYLIYKAQLKSLGEECCQLRIPVQVDLKKSGSGNFYCTGIHKLPQPITEADLNAISEPLSSEDIAF